MDSDALLIIGDVVETSFGAEAIPVSLVLRYERAPLIVTNNRSSVAEAR